MMLDVDAVFHRLDFDNFMLTQPSVNTGKEGHFKFCKT